MKQVIRKGFRDIIVDEVPEPLVTPHHVLIRPLYSLISSGTETASIHQEAIVREVVENPSQLRQIWEVMKVSGPFRTMAEVKAKFSDYAALGYSGAGILVDKHPTVNDLEIGDRVAYGGEGAGHAETIITGRNLTVKVPDAVPLEHACFTTLGSIAMNAVRIANIGLGDIIAVIGMGIVGQLIAQLVKRNGGVVIAIDLIQNRIELAKQLGAEFTLLGDESVLDKVHAITDGRGVDCSMVAAASKSSAPSLQAVQICRDRGTIVNVGAVQLQFPYGEMYRKEIRFFMSRAYGPGSYDETYEKHGQDYPISYVRWTENRNMSEFLRQVSLEHVRVDSLITHQFHLEEAPKAYETILDPSSGSLAVILRYSAAETEQPLTTHKPERKVCIDSRESSKSDIQVALVGASNIARWAHLPDLMRIPHVSLKAVFSSSGVRGKSYARRFGAEYCCTDYEKVLEDPDIDVVLITSRHQFHYEQALAALRAGKHVFLEKPMALTVEECKSLFDVVEETGKVLTVGFNRRFAPYYIKLKRYLSRREGPAVLNCRINSPGISGAFWAADPAIGGAILGEAVHFIDLMYWLLESEPVGVMAFSLPTGRDDPIGQNNMAVCFHFTDGSIGNLTYCTVGSRKSGGERVEMFMKGCGISVEDFKRFIVKTNTTRRLTRLWPEKGYSAQMKSFLSRLREGKQPEVTVRDGARATICALRMLESARTLRPCAVDLEEALR